MNREAIKDLIYGGILELMHNRNYYYAGYASISSPSFGCWTDEGKKALSEFMGSMAYLMLKAEIEELDRRAKDLVFKHLKGDN
jgi:hypothetical protein